jgi:hypothetical protein
MKRLTPAERSATAQPDEATDHGLRGTFFGHDTDAGDRLRRHSVTANTISPELGAAPSVPPGQTELPLGLSRSTPKHQDETDPHQIEPSRTPDIDWHQAWESIDLATIDPHHRIRPSALHRTDLEAWFDAQMAGSSGTPL